MSCLMRLRGKNEENKEKGGKIKRKGKRKGIEKRKEREEKGN